jgi:hypothetical protein
MKVTALVLTSALLLASSSFAGTTLNAKALTKSIASVHQHPAGDKDTIVMVYGGQDVARGRIMSTLDKTVLAG